MALSRLALLFAVAALAGGAAHARGQLQVRQTGLELAGDARGGRLQLANGGDRAVAAQVRVFAWTQVDGEDRLEPSEALVASPPIAEIPAGGQQLVRVVRNDAAAPAREQAYRLVVDELPGPAGDADGNAVHLRMRFLVPVFVRAPGAAPAALRCRIEATALACRNDGGRAAQLGASTLLAADGRRQALTSGLLGYVLAGNVRRFPLEAARAPSGAAWSKLEVRLDGQPATLELAAGP